jgi:hypothetical protein
MLDPSEGLVILLGEVGNITCTGGTPGAALGVTTMDRGYRAPEASVFHLHRKGRSAHSGVGTGGGEDGDGARPPDLDPVRGGEGREEAPGVATPAQPAI